MKETQPEPSAATGGWAGQSERAAWSYAGFRKIDGTHPLRAWNPNGYVDYPARRLHGGQVLYFNFHLAREMGLLAAGHPDCLTPGLTRAVLGTFCLQIVNEYDALRKTPIPARDLLPRMYLASRYLQIQHPGRRGTTSGDGRSIWNGTFTGRNGTWDVTSCGTGVTRLCPATATTKRFYKTGSRRASYGCGTASPEEGIGAALMSEVFHRNGIGTERVLAVIRRADGFGITVRAGRNLLRPSHFFAPLKQADLGALKGLVDGFIERQIANGAMPHETDPRRRFALFAEVMARSFARTAATFERNYIFCWMDWDGDNILADGGIIDYGSVRQFGLFHREYRYDDGPRYSTTITEQRRKARYTVQAAAQIREFLTTGRRPPLRSLARDPVLSLFDREFELTKDRLLLRQIGFDKRAQDALLRHDRGLVQRFDRVFASFERARSSRGPKPCPDGITWDAVYCLRDVLRELPGCLLRDYRRLRGRDFLALALSIYASRKDRQPSRYRLRQAREFQRLYMMLIARAARRTGKRRREILETVHRRSAAINRLARVTGDSVSIAARTLLRHRRGSTPQAFQSAVTRFIDEQTLNPDRTESRADLRTGAAWEEAIARRLAWIVNVCRHGI